MASLKRVNRANPVTTRMPSNIRTAVPKTTVGALGIQPLACWPHCPLPQRRVSRLQSTSMNDDALVKSVMAWEREWFRKVTSFPPESPTRAIALRILRHSIWYLRSRYRDEGDRDGRRLLLKCLNDVKRSS